MVLVYKNDGKTLEIHEGLPKELKREFGIKNEAAFLTSSANTRPPVVVVQNTRRKITEKQLQEAIEKFKKLKEKR